MADGNIYEKLRKVQLELKAPRNEDGRFGKSRSAEGILEAAKPVCVAHGLTLVSTEELVQVGERYYIKHSATVYDDKGDSITGCAYAQEGGIDRGLDASQVTGKTSSYAKKYALQNLLAIDDTKDADYGPRPEIEREIDAQTISPRPAVATKQPAAHITIGQAQLMIEKAKRAWNITDKVELLDEFIAKFGKAVNEITTDEYDDILKQLVREQ